VCAARLTNGQLPGARGCRPFEVLEPGHLASDSVRIGGRLVPRTQRAVRDAWQAAGVRLKEFGAVAGERVIIYRDSQPAGSAIYDGCTMVFEQLPVPAYWRPDSISNINIVSSDIVAQRLHDRRGYQYVYVTVARQKPDTSDPI
jgi:hypothetical protein